MEHRKQSFELPQREGDAVHGFLTNEETLKLLDSKLPPDSERRALLNVRVSCLLGFTLLACPDPRGRSTWMFLKVAMIASQARPYLSFN